MFGKSKVLRYLFTGLVAVSLSTAVVLFSGCPEEPAGFEEPAEEPAEPAPEEDMELPEM